MAQEKLSLDVDSPEKVTRALLNASEAFYVSAGELESSWSDPSAGKPWLVLARELEAAADRIEKKLAPLGFSYRRRR